MLKMKTSGLLEKTKIGQLLSDFIEHMKSILRYLLRPKKMIFEDLGFKYYGPIDGHNIEEIERYLSSAKKMKGPILIHVMTQKGKGYEFAEQAPEKFHGIAPFEISNGMTHTSQKVSKGKFSSFSMAFGKFLTDFARNDSSITAVCAAMPGGTGLERFYNEFPKRFFDVGIAEQHAITMAAGMACAGLKPVVAIYSTFLQRAYDQLLHDVALQDLHVVLCIDRAGIVGEDGETHQGIYDLALLTTIPSIEILSPRNYKELYRMMYHALYHSKGPVAIRYPRGGELTLPEEYEKTSQDLVEIHPVLLKSGKDLTIITEGIMAGKGALASIEIEKSGYSCELIDICSIKPIKETMLLESIQKTKHVITIENAITRGGLGSEIEKLIVEKGIQARIITIGVSDRPLCQGKIEELYEQEGMDVLSIVSQSIALLRE
jgi:1-deoxy-D-xylulose-5-phosphate synthase